MSENQYHPDDTDAATLAAFVALGSASIVLRYEVQCQGERADEYQLTAVKLANERNYERAVHDDALKMRDEMHAAMLDECASLRAQLDAAVGERDYLRGECRKLGDELAKPARGVTWGDVQVLMVQNGIQEITRVDTYHWRTVSRDHEYEGKSLEDAAGRAARAFAAILGKAVTA